MQKMGTCAQLSIILLFEQEQIPMENNTGISILNFLNVGMVNRIVGTHHALFSDGQTAHEIRSLLGGSHSAAPMHGVAPSINNKS